MAVSILTTRVKKPDEDDWGKLKRVLRYVKGTQHMKLRLCMDNMEVIKSADWLIDLGPEGGDQGGNLLYQGPPQGILKVKESYTAQFLGEKLNGR